MFSIVVIPKEIVFVISHYQGRLTLICVFPRRNCNLHLARQLMQLVFKGFFEEGGRRSHGPNVTERP